ncbi:MAG TPA: hypothetical protein VGI39_19505 [Polyangiaceae bacterium]|jgi:hypothetical protein
MKSPLPLLVPLLASAALAAFACSSNKTKTLPIDTSGGGTGGNQSAGGSAGGQADGGPSGEDSGTATSAADASDGAVLCASGGCNGCCDTLGVCQSGTTSASCGVLGSPCEACPSPTTCLNGFCQ